MRRIAGELPKNGYNIAFLEQKDGVPVDLDHEPIGSDDMLLAVWESTKAFHQRFDKFPPVFKECVAMFDEEMREFNALIQMAKDAIKTKDADLFTYNNAMQLLSEFADVMVTACGIFTALSLDYGEFKSETIEVIKKNNAKTTDTHYVDRNNGKITKKG